METLSIRKISEFADAVLRQGDMEFMVPQLCTDSRKLRPDEMFVALAGENFDGHNFVAKAAQIGAAGALVHRAADTALPEKFAVLEVSDTLLAYQKIAHRYRMEMPAKVIGITGSNGKTSTKDYVASVMGSRFRTLKTEGNFNNHIGVPITLLQLNRSHEMAILEMGMNHPGEIAPLAAMAQPEAAIITNIGIAHIEYLGSREAIALEKGMLAESIPAHGIVILNGDDDMSRTIAHRCKCQVVFVGIDHGDITAESISQSLEGSQFVINAGGKSAPARLNAPGLHMVRNGLLAVAAGLHFGISLEECAAALASANLTKGRLQRKSLGKFEFLDDSYNANPDSMIAALLTLSQIPISGKRIAVLGRMGELGVEAEKGHRNVGQAAITHGIDCVISVGNEAHWITETARNLGLRNAYETATVTAAASLLKQLANPGDMILIKGSRSSGMEKVLEEFGKLEQQEAAL